MVVIICAQQARVGKPEHIGQESLARLLALATHVPVCYPVLGRLASKGKKPCGSPPEKATHIAAVWTLSELEPGILFWDLLHSVLSCSTEIVSLHKHRRTR